MEVLFSREDVVHDERAAFAGFIEVERLSFYDEGEGMVPSSALDACYPKTPCLVWEEFDHDLSTKDCPLLKPVRWVAATRAQADFLKETVLEVRR